MTSLTIPAISIASKTTPKSSTAIPAVSRLSLVELEPVPVPEVLSSPHRLTLQLQKSLSRRTPDSYGRVRSSSDDINVKVAPASIPRALLFVDAFVRAAEERGYAFTPRASDCEPGMSVLIKLEKVQFCIFEEVTSGHAHPLEGQI
jgi:hypothetical protein